jgi:hypothetical protein
MFMHKSSRKRKNVHVSFITPAAPGLHIFLSGSGHAGGAVLPLMRFRSKEVDLSDTFICDAIAGSIEFYKARKRECSAAIHTITESRQTIPLCSSFCVTTHHTSPSTPDSAIATAPHRNQ